MKINSVFHKNIIKRYIIKANLKTAIKSNKYFFLVKDTPVLIEIITTSLLRINNISRDIAFSREGEETPSDLNDEINVEIYKERISRSSCKS